MAEFKQGSRYVDGKESTFRGKTTIFPKYINPRQLEFVKFVEVRPGEEYRDDLISLKAFGRDDLGWLIMLANDIDHPEKLTVGTQLGVPRLRGVL